MSDRITHNSGNDGIDRRGFLKCMAWVGTGVLWTVRGGILSSRAIGAEVPARFTDHGDFTFVQISDSHIGFAREPNQDVIGTLKLAVDRINAMPTRPAFLIHTGDLTHMSKPAEFDTVSQIVKSVRIERDFYVPGEHDYSVDDGKSYLERFGKGTHGDGWYSYDYKGVHFVGLVNVANANPNGLGQLGHEQLDWLKKDVAGLTDSTPIVLLAHIPLWTVYEKWGWGTDDAAEALSYLKRFGSVTALNGHIHQAMQKVEGNITFHTACSTAFPQPAPGHTKSPGPMKNVAADKLRTLLGLTTVKFVQYKSALAIVDSTLDQSR